MLLNMRKWNDHHFKCQSVSSIPAAHQDKDFLATHRQEDDDDGKDWNDDTHQTSIVSQMLYNNLLKLVKHSLESEK